jgi:hypothetical protein
MLICNNDIADTLDSKFSKCRPTYASYVVVTIDIFIMKQLKYENIL